MRIASVSPLVSIVVVAAGVGGLYAAWRHGPRQKREMRRYPLLATGGLIQRAISHLPTWLGRVILLLMGIGICALGVASFFWD